MAANNKQTAEVTSGELCQSSGEGSVSSETMFNLESFEQELQWCVDQLQLGLERQNPDSKQAQEAVKILKILQSSKAPLVKKRQAMRNTFGDYRAKMKKEQAKSAAAAKKMKLTAVDEMGYLKSQFFKKSSSQNSRIQTTSSGATNDLDISGAVVDCTGDQLNENFRFNFSISENSSENQGSSMSKDNNENTSVIDEATASGCDFRVSKSDNAFRFNFDIKDKT